MACRVAERLADYWFVARSHLSRHPGLDDLATHVSVPTVRPALVFLPGIWEGSEFLGPLCVALARDGWALRYSYIDRSRLSVGALARQVIVDLEQYRGPVVLVGHSKGGLVGRAILAARSGGEPTLPQVAGLVSLATPWNGSILARLALPGSAVRDLAPSGIDIRTPWGHAREKELRSKIVSISPSWDPHVPGDRSLAGARNYTVATTGHFRFLADPETIHLVRLGARLLAAESGRPAP